MPFDGLPEGLLSDIAKLRVALAGVEKKWRCGALGLIPEESHCALGWLLVATDGNIKDATRLAVDYVYPALPDSARRGSRIESIYRYNDLRGQNSVAKLFKNAVDFAERALV